MVNSGGESKRKPHQVLHALNLTALVLLLAIPLALIGLGRMQGNYPYDYALLHFGGDAFCFHPDEFAYTGEYLYPAPFYTTFCGFFRYTPELLYVVWMVAPFILVLILAGQRAAVLVYPPFYIHMLLGQSTWLLLPVYWLANRASEEQSVRWWYGLVVPLALLKPHIALLPLVWLLYVGRKKLVFWFVALLSALVVLLPSFILYPAWLWDWLSAGRGFKIPSIANVGIIPIQLLQLGETEIKQSASSGAELIVLAFCGVIALGLLAGLYWRRGKLEFYDWVLVFAFTNPFMHDYDLIILLPFIANRPKRLLLALTAGIVVWVYAGFTYYYNASVIISMALLAARFLRLDEHDPIQLALRYER